MSTAHQFEVGLTEVLYRDKAGVAQHSQPLGQVPQVAVAHFCVRRPRREQASNRMPSANHDHHNPTKCRKLAETTIVTKGVYIGLRLCIAAAMVSHWSVVGFVALAAVARAAQKPNIVLLLTVMPHRASCIDESVTQQLRVSSVQPYTFELAPPVR
jgi:hypothetical protein